MTVKVEKPAVGVSLITLNRPEKLNSFNEEMRQALLAALRQASADDAVRIVVLTGEGRGFCTGADVTDLDGLYTIEDVLNAEYGAFLNIIQTMPKPVIAAINGPAAGIGMTLALTCDLRMMGEDAYLMSAFANIGLVPDGGLSWLLTQQLGYARAFQLAIEAEKISAAKALDWGLVNQVVPTANIVSDVLTWAQSLAERSSSSIALTKYAFRLAAQNGLRNAMAFEAMAQRMALATDDCTEGLTALLEKRKPNFKQQ